jgi:hypothetical protein
LAGKPPADLDVDPTEEQAISPPPEAVLDQRQQSGFLFLANHGGGDLANCVNVLLRWRWRNEGIEFHVRWRTVEVAVRAGDVALTDAHEIQACDDIRDESVGLDALP